MKHFNNPKIRIKAGNLSPARGWSHLQEKDELERTHILLEAFGEIQERDNTALHP